MCDRAKNLAQLCELAKMADDKDAMWDRVACIKLVLEKAEKYIGNDVAALYTLAMSFSTFVGIRLSIEKFIADGKMVDIQSAFALCMLAEESLSRRGNKNLQSIPFLNLIAEKARPLIVFDNETDFSDLSAMFKVNSYDVENKASGIIDLALEKIKTVAEVIAFVQNSNDWGKTNKILFSYVSKKGLAVEDEATAVLGASNVNSKGAEALVNKVVEICQSKGWNVYSVLQQADCFGNSSCSFLQSLLSDMGGFEIVSVGRHGL
jgi:hypothetical protein